MNITQSLSTNAWDPSPDNTVGNDIRQFNSGKPEAEQEDRELELHIMEYNMTEKGDVSIYHILKQKESWQKETSRLD